MDYKDIEFDKELLNYYVPCLNNCYVRKDRVLCYCELHGFYVSKKQGKRKKCFQKNCKYARNDKKNMQ